MHVHVCGSVYVCVRVRVHVHGSVCVYLRLCACVNFFDLKPQEDLKTNTYPRTPTGAHTDTGTRAYIDGPPPSECFRVSGGEVPLRGQLRLIHCHCVFKHVAYKVPGVVLR